MVKLIPIVAAFLLTACASVGVKKENLSTLQNQKITDGNKQHSLIFSQMDGKELSTGAFSKPNEASIYVAPGKTELNLKVTHTTDEPDLVWAAKADVSVVLKEYEIYTIRAKENDWCMKIEVLDSSERVVAGPVYEKLYPYLSYNHMKNKYLMNRVKNIMKSTSCN